MKELTKRFSFRCSHCRISSTESKVRTTLQDSMMHSKRRRVWLSETPLIPHTPRVPGGFHAKIERRSCGSHRRELFHPRIFRKQSSGVRACFANGDCSKVALVLANEQPKNPYVPPGVNKAVLLYMPCTMTSSNCQSILTKNICFSFLCFFVCLA